MVRITFGCLTLFIVFKIHRNSYAFDMMNGVDISKLDSLCDQYGLPKDSTSNYLTLVDVYTAKMKGEYYTNAEINADSTAVDLANMLRKISIGGGAFTIAGNPYKYRNEAFIEGLRKYLTDELLKRVEKVPQYNYLLLSVGFGSGGYQGRGHIVPVPDGDILPKNEGFSKSELDALIAKGEELKYFVEISEGKVQKFYKEGKHTYQAELGELAECFLQGLPENWTITNKNCFVADFMRISGFLDKRGDSYLYEFDKFDKDRKNKEVKAWMNAYDKKDCELWYHSGFSPQ